MPDVRKAIEQVAVLGPGGGEVIDTLTEHGYEFESVVPAGGEFVATASKTINGRRVPAQALGRTKIDAARSLVKTIKRR